MEYETIRLFRENRICDACWFSCDTYDHGFARGHTVLIRNERCLFIPDDIWYSFPQNVQFDMASLFIKLGWRELESCPKCGSQRLSPAKFDKANMLDLPCIEIHASFFEEENGRWELTANAKERFSEQES
jgi:hypothetical protein